MENCKYKDIDFKSFKKIYELAKCDLNFIKGNLSLMSTEDRLQYVSMVECLETAYSVGNKGDYARAVSFIKTMLVDHTLYIINKYKGVL